MRREHAAGIRVEPLEDRALMSTLIVDRGANNAPRAAQVVPLDPGDGRASITGRASRQDRDFFVLNPTVTGDLTLTLADSGRGTVRVDVMEGGQRVLRQAVRGGTTNGVVSVTAGQPVVLRVKVAGRGSASYRLLLTEPAVVSGTIVRPNPNPQNPVPITTGGGSTPGSTENSPMPTSPGTSSTTLTLDASGKARASGTIATSGDTDVYLLTPPRSGRLSFSIRRSGANPVTLTVTDATGKQRLKLDSDIPSLIAYFPAQMGETYTITIAARDGVPAPYTMTAAES